MFNLNPTGLPFSDSSSCCNCLTMSCDECEIIYWLCGNSGRLAYLCEFHEIFAWIRHSQENQHQNHAKSDIEYNSPSSSTANKARVIKNRLGLAKGLVTNLLNVNSLIESNQIEKCRRNADSLTRSSLCSRTRLMVIRMSNRKCCNRWHNALCGDLFGISLWRRSLIKCAIGSNTVVFCWIPSTSRDNLRKVFGSYKMIWTLNWCSGSGADIGRHMFFSLTTSGASVSYSSQT